MNHDDRREALGAVLEREISLAHDLGRALADEADALREVDPTALDAATAAKQLCVEQLSALDAERQHLCAASPGDGARGRVETVLTDLDASGGLTERWQSLMALLDTCREANQRNGAIVSIQRRRVVEALGLLRGTPGAVTYDASGEVGEADSPRLHTRI